MTRCFHAVCFLLHVKCYQKALCPASSSLPLRRVALRRGARCPRGLQCSRFSPRHSNSPKLPFPHAPSPAGSASLSANHSQLLRIALTYRECLSLSHCTVSSPCEVTFLCIFYALRSLPPEAEGRERSDAVPAERGCDVSPTGRSPARGRSVRRHSSERGTRRRVVHSTAPPHLLAI